jgi:ribonucleotide reductase alpha subunit
MIGLGIMGFADILFFMARPYNSPERRETTGSIMQLIQTTAINESVKLGDKKGSFPNDHKSKWAGKYPTIRNGSLTNVSPTRSTSLLFGVSSGLEPCFTLKYDHETSFAIQFDPGVNSTYEVLSRKQAVSMIQHFKTVPDRDVDWN